MLRTDRTIIAFAAFEAIGFAALFALATAGVDEFRHVDPLGWLPLFVALQALALTGLLTGVGLACGWGMNRLRLLLSAKRIARAFAA